MLETPLLPLRLPQKYSFVLDFDTPIVTMSWLPLGGALILLMIDSAIEMALISSMVGYLHRSGANKYPFLSDTGALAFIGPKPKGLLLNEGHTSNGASGTALIIVCFGGFLVLWNERRRERRVISVVYNEKRLVC